MANRKYGMVGKKWGKRKEQRGKSLMKRLRMGKRDVRGSCRKKDIGRSWRKVREKS